MLNVALSLSVSGYKLDGSYKYAGHSWNKVSDTCQPSHTCIL